MYASRQALAFGCALALACGATAVTLPVKGPEPPPGAFVGVPDAPPPGRVEIVRLAANDKAVWTGGQWERVDAQWRWVRGGWVVPPPGARFTGFRVRREKDGSLRFAAARWTDATLRPIEVGQPQAKDP